MAASCRIISQGQLDWAVKKGIKSVVTIREIPLSAKWFEKHPEIDHRDVKVSKSVVDQGTSIEFNLSTILVKHYIKVVLSVGVVINRANKAAYACKQFSLNWS
ncbi:MAG TPA: hypothetical protein VF220_02500 [Nitrososphaeraceae archaeon]